MKVSIVIPAYNAEDTVERAFKSALGQTFPENEREVIVVNDGSTDRTRDILERYGERIRLIDQENQGAVGAANTGFTEAQGEYIIKLDSDDYFESDILAEMVPVFEKDSNIDYVYCDYYEVQPNGDRHVVSTAGTVFATVAIGIMFRRTSFAAAGFYRDKVKFPEYDLLLRTSEDWTGHHIPKPLFTYCRRKESITGDKAWVAEAKKELRELHPDRESDIEKIREY